MPEQVDVVVVGMGVGGEAVGGTLAEKGLAVVGVEGRLVGGECPYWACVPSKMMIRGSNLLVEARRVDGMSGHTVVVPDWRPVASRIREEATDDWNDRAAVERFTGKGGRFVRGWGRLTGPGRVEVDGELYEARLGVVLASGTAPNVPPIDGLDATPYWTNREAIEAKSLPESLVVLGGGPVGVELAQVFARFGVPVTVLEADDRLLSNEEPEASELAAESLERDGIGVHTGVQVSKVSHDGSVFILQGDGGSEHHAERLLVAVGRRSNLTNVGLDTVGLDPEAPVLTVDEHMRAGEKLWAVGDVTGHGAFTHVAMYQSQVAVRSILSAEGDTDDGPPADYRAVPRVTFTDPEIGSVGLTEAKARDAGLDVQAGVAQIPSSARGWIHKKGNEGFVKLVADSGRGVLVGATSAGPTGGEVLGALVVAVYGEVPVESLRHMMYAYPTFHRTIEDALRELS